MQWTICFRNEEKCKTYVPRKLKNLEMNNYILTSELQPAYLKVLSLHYSYRKIDGTLDIIGF